MLSKAFFDLDQSNNPVIEVEVASTPDVRDKIAKRFIERLGSESQWCEILPVSESKYIIFPLTPSELRKTAALMIDRADKIDEEVKIELH